ncbi:MAG: hypothetical protein ACI35Q_01300 [Marinilabiliaceae bacterium]
MANAYSDFSKGEWVVRTADYNKAGGDVNKCEWLFVLAVKGNATGGTETVTVEKYDDETGDVVTELGRMADFVATGVSAPGDSHDRILSGIAAICPGLTDEEWETVRMMVGETVGEEA